MRVAIASGKGGTGKTTVATNLTYLASRNGETVAYLDCDVEEPNGHLFLKPQIAERRTVERLVPHVDAEKCTLCGKCGAICQYNAIVCAGKKVLVFPELCHGCGGCAHVCSIGAVSEVPLTAGRLEIGVAGPVQFVEGVLNVGEAMSPPVIRAVKDAVPDASLVILDAPPGTSCSAVESVRGCDYVVLVTEPTPFGLNDLRLAVEMVKALGLRVGVVVNRCDIGDETVWDYCRENAIEILAEIPTSREVAEVYSRGELVCEALPELDAVFSTLLQVVLAKRDRE